MTVKHKILPLWGRWQREALTEGDWHALCPPPPSAVPLPQRGRIG